ncbi:MAG: DUF4291 domain-containing protein [Candidatus Promineifilaceae bacterium]
MWPKSGRHILAQFDQDSIVVYQAYKPSIGHFAVDNGFFGGDFSYSRMSWIKPNFLWMMYRSGWGVKPDQEITLAIRLKRSYFDVILNEAVPSTWDASLYPLRDDWQQAVTRSDVRLQWDPDHDPSGKKEERRAIQLGLRGAALEGFKGDGIVSIEDVSDFVAEQRSNANNGRYANLLTPAEAVYPVTDSAIRGRLGLDEGTTIE